MSSEWLWYISRASGVVSAVLLTVVVLLGLYTAAAKSRNVTLDAGVMVLHRMLGLGTSLFLLAHIATAVLDSYVSISPLAAVVPFTSAYERGWVTLGTLAIDLLLAIIVTSLLRDRLSPRAWRAVHLTSYLMAPLALVHGIAMGTDGERPLTLVMIGCAVVLGVAAIARLLVTTSRDGARRRAITAQEWP